MKAGVEASPHLARQWFTDKQHDAGRILVNSDEANAHNEVDRHTFLTRMREISPGVARWLEYIYPTEIATKVFYRGRVIDSVSGGQQGCPLIGVCHAVTKRLLYEAIGLVPPLAGSSIQLPVMDPPAALDMAPAFADDGLLAGEDSEVLRALLHLRQVMPQVGLRFSTLQVVPAAGHNSNVNFEPFVDAGCQILHDGNVEVLNLR